MPSKRTNDSVDEILHQLDRQQAARDLNSSLTDRQVDDILRSVGVLGGSGGAPAADLGPIDLGDLPSVEVGSDAPVLPGEERFSTQMLDELLGDLPSLRQAAPAAPRAPQRPAARRPEPQAQKQTAPAQAVPRQAAPAAQAPQRPAARRPEPQAQKQTAQTAPRQPAPAAQTPQRPAARQTEPPAQQQTAPAQAASRQPAPAAQTPQRRADTSGDTTTGLGDTTRTGIIKNFLLKMAPGGADADQGALNQGKKEFQRFFGESAAVVPDEKGRLHAPKKKHGLFGLGSVEDSDEFVPINVSLTGTHTEQEAPDTAVPEQPLQGETPAAPPPKKRGLFGRLFKAAQGDDEELYIPEARETEPQPQTTYRGVVLEDDETEDLPVTPEQLSMQLPVENIRSRYTAGRGNGLDMPPALQESAEEQSLWPAQETSAYAVGDLYAQADPELGSASIPTGEIDLGADLPNEPDLLKGILPGTSTLEFLQQGTAPDTRTAPAGASPSGGTVYRKKRTTVEFVPGQGRRPSQNEPTVTYRAAGPVGEPVMTDDRVAPLPEAEPLPVPPQAEPEQPQPEPTPSTGFTMQIGAAQQSEDTQFFLDAYDQARSMHQKPAAGDATGETPLDAAPQEAPDTSQFVRNIEQSINEDGNTGTADPTDRFAEAAQILAYTESDLPDMAAEKAPPLRLDGVPQDEQTGSITSPFIAAPHTAQHSYDKPEDAPAVRKDLDRQTLVLTVSAIITGVLAAVLVYLGVAAFGTADALPGPLSLAGGKLPLLVTMLVLLAVACALSWRTLLWGFAGLVRTPSPDSMPALAAAGALVQLVVFMIWPDLYDPARFCLFTGPAVLLLCANTAGKALDAHTLRAGFEIVSAKTEHAVARRLVESGLLQAATRGLGEPRPCVLISRPTELFKGFLTNASARRPSDKNQQQFARGLLVCAALSVAFTFVYHRDAGKAVTALAAVFCLGTPLASTLLSAVPAHLMQRSAARVGAVIPGWHDIRQLGRINVIHLTARDLFPTGTVRLCGIKPVHKEYIDRAIIYAASVLANGCQSMQDIFLGMLGDNRKLLAKVDDLETVYGKGYIGWIDGERVLVGNRRLMEDYQIKLPSLDYEQRHTVNQRRFVYLAVSGKLYSVFQVAYQRDPDTAAVLDNLRRSGISLVVDCDDFNCDVALLEAVYTLPTGTVKVLTAQERETLEPATAWLPESSGNMLHLGNFASFVGGLEAAAGAAEGERRAGMVLSASVLLSAVLSLILSVPQAGITALPLLALVLYQVAWCVLALIFPLIQRY